MASRTPKLTLSVQHAAPGHPLPTRRQLRAWAGAALERDAEVTLRVVHETEGRQLNHDYRGKDHATNVLTFVYASRPLAGDIVICAPVVLREARAQGKAVEAHHAHLLVHGLLHLQGYDHERDDEAARMEGREKRVMRALGFGDPYAAR